jgi:hypothetical protein
MARKFPNPKPTSRRTREHVLADLSINHVERIFLEAGWSVLRTSGADYGYDLIVNTFTPEGYAEPGALLVQVRATDHLASRERDRSDTFACSIETRHYHLWRAEQLPVLFILYHGAGKKAYWLYAQEYFHAHPPPRPQARSYTVHVPRKNVLGMRTIERLRRYKDIAHEQAVRRIHPHG